MQQFLRGSDRDFAALHERAQSATISFSNQPLPPGTRPARGRVGFRTDERGLTVLFVDVCEQPPDDAPPAVRDWLTHGGLEFDSFEDCVAWIRSELADAYGAPPPDPATLTDLGAVSRGLRRTETVPTVDEAALRRRLQADVRGQDATVVTLSHRAALHAMQTAPRRPLTLFAVGPTGVGKTLAGSALADALAEAGTDYRYLRLDMSEYQEKHTVSKLLGAPAGYVGYGDGAALVDALRDGTPTVVHFDEIEKAHPNVFRALMNAMDAGRLQATGPGDGPGGREIDCRRAVFYFTSNLRADAIEDALRGHAHGDAPHVVDEVCRQELRAAGVPPELVGRVHGFLAFRPLSRSARAEVAALAVSRVAAQFGVRVGRIEPSVLVHLLSESDDGFGARPLETLVESQLGPAFVAARRYGSVPLVVSGPPYRCGLPGDDVAPGGGPDVTGVDLGNLPTN